MIVTNFTCDLDEVKLANIDSLLCNSGQCIAELELERDVSKSNEEYVSQKECVELHIYGEVRIRETINGSDYIYRNADQYSERLINALKTHSIYDDDDFEIIDNNWVELVYTVDGEYSPDGYVCDGEFGDTEESVKNYLIQMASEIYDIPAEKTHIAAV